MKILLFFLLAFIGFAVGNCGLGGSLLVTVTTLAVSTAFFVIRMLYYLFIVGVQHIDDNSNRSPGGQAMIIIVHGAWAFAYVLYYGMQVHQGLDDSISYADGLAYWKTKIIVAVWITVFAMIITAIISKREWLDDCWFDIRWRFETSLYESRQRRSLARRKGRK